MHAVAKLTQQFKLNSAFQQGGGGSSPWSHPTSYATVKLYTVRVGACMGVPQSTNGVKNII